MRISLLFFGFSCFSYLAQVCNPPIAGGLIVNGITNDSINVCIGANVSFQNTGSFAQSGFTISSYSWDFNDGTFSTLANPSHTFTSAGHYFVQLTITDNNSGNPSPCRSTNTLNLEVLVAPNPNLTDFQSDMIVCAGESITIDANPNDFEATWSNIHQANVITSGCIIDNATENIDLPQAGFVSGSIITNVSQIQSICLDLEHSYIADVSIRLFCPNGQNALLHDHGGGGLDFGSANSATNVDCSNPSTFGPSYSYCFTPSSTLNTGNGPSSNGSLSAGQLASINPLSNFIGCPTNGNWSIQIIDNATGDDGNFTRFELNLAPELLSGNSPTILNNGCLLDNLNVVQNFDLPQTGFLVGSSITAVNQIESICLSMEHSYMNDLQLKLICPNGQFVLLHDHTGGSAQFGIGNTIAPINCSDPTSQGTPYSYCFASSASQLAGNAVAINGSIPAGNYLPVNSYSNLIGCPSNGLWKIQAIDNGSGDDGKIFSFKLNLAPILQLSQDLQFTPQIGFSSDSSFWTIPVGWTGNLSNQNNSITINPRVGSSPVVYTMTNNFGCTSQASFILQAIAPPTVVTNDGFTCIGHGYVLTASGANSYTFPNGSAYVVPTQTTNYMIYGTNAIGCMDSVIAHVEVKPLPNLSISSSSSILCVGSPAILTGNGAESYVWAPGGIGNEIQINLSQNQNYSVVGTDSNGCVATAIYTQITEDCAFLTNEFINETKVYPNPSNDVLTISSNQIIKNYTVLDIYGNLIELKEVKSVVSSIDTKEYTNGSYLILLNFITNEIENIKFVVAH
jgi:subtilisin-like proprotein convertase family protein